MKEERLQVSEGNGHDAREEPPVTFEQRVESYFLEIHAMFHSLATTQEVQGKKITHIQADVEIIRKDQERLNLLSSALPPPRPPAPSFSTLDTDDGEEIITENGGRKFAYSDEKLREKMRKEYMQIVEQERLQADANFTRNIRARGNATMWAVITAGILGAFGGLMTLIKHWIDSDLKH